MINIKDKVYKALTDEGLEVTDGPGLKYVAD